MWRFGILLAIVGSLALFAWQNSSPAIALVFLGMRSQAMPLAFWILLALLAGVLTQLLLTGLYQIGLALAPEADEPEVWGDGSWPDSPVDDRSRPEDRLDPEPAIADRWRDSPEPTVVDRAQPSIDLEDESDILEEDDWDEAPQPAPTRELDLGDRVYEREQQPRSQQRDGSVYSFSYRDATAFGAGRTEDVYDAEYRVLIPPYRKEIGAADDDEQDSEDTPEFADISAYQEERDEPEDWADRSDPERFDADRFEVETDPDNPEYDPIAEADRLAGIRTGKSKFLSKTRIQRTKTILSDRPALTAAQNDWDDSTDDDWDDWDDGQGERDRDW